MKKNIVLFLLSVLSFSLQAQQRGYYDAPYTRYEADAATLGGGATVQSSYNQDQITFEASDRTSVLANNGGSVTWNNVAGNFNKVGITLRFAIADGVNNRDGDVTRNVDLSINGTYITTLTLHSRWSWEHLWDNGNGNNDNISNQNYRMRFDEIRYRVDNSYNGPITIKLEAKGSGVYFDFIEVENVPDAIPCPDDFEQYSGNGSDLQNFVDRYANCYIPAGTFNIGRTLELNADDKVLRGAGPWYTTINFTGTASCETCSNNGGLWSNFDARVSDLSLTTDRSSRSFSYKGINGSWGPTSVIENVFVDHFECGAWIANYNTGWGNSTASGLTIRHCRFRNNYADGVNLCKGSHNCVVEHCSFRNNGDDDMAVWPADGQQCYNNTYQYNTAEHCYRASSCALYGGYGNKWQYIVVKDNYEVGIRVASTFAGACFGDGAANEMNNIDVIGCGTWNSIYGFVEGAVEVTQSGYACNGVVKNVKLSCIDIIDSNSDAFQFRNENGNSIQNVQIDGITINGTSKRGYTNNAGWGNACGFRFIDSPNMNNCSHGTYNEDNSGTIKITDVEGEKIAAYGSKWNNMTTSTFASCVTVEDIEATITSNNSPVCEGEAITLSGSQTGASSPAYTWKFSATGNYASATNVGTGTTLNITNATTANAGTYYFLVESNGYSDYDEAEVTVNAAPSAPSASGTSVCSGQKATLTVTGSDTYKWYTAATGGIASGEGNSFATPAITSNTDFYVSATKNGCESSRTKVTVALKDNMAIAKTSGDDNQQVCVNAQMGTIKYNVSNATGADVVWTPRKPAGVSDSYANGTVTIEGTPSEIGEFTYVITPQGGCGTASAEGKITVNAIPTISAGGNVATAFSVAQNETLTLTPSVAGGAWNVDNTNVAEISGNVLTGKSVNSTTATYTVNGCSVTINITVTAPNVSTFELTSDNATQTFCAGPALEDIVYAASNVSDVEVTGLPASVNYTFENNTLTISGTPTASGEFNFTVTPTPLYGTIAPLTGKITVNAVPTISAEGNTATAFSVAQNETLTLTPSVAGGAWNVDNTNVAEISGNVLTGKSVGITTATYSVNGCDVTVNITVTAPNVSTFELTSDNATQTFCAGPALEDIVYAASNVSDVEVTGLPTGVNYTFENNTLTISGTPTASGEFNFTVTPTPIYGTIAPLTGKITVNAIPTISAGGNVATTFSVAQNETLTLTPSIAGGTWNVDNTNVAEISGNVLTGKSVGTTTATYSVNGCSVTINITVTAPNVSTFELTSDNATQTFCQGETLVDIVYAASNVSDVEVTGLPAGVNYTFENNTLTISGTPTASGEFNFTVTPTPLYGTIAPLTGKITVNAVPTIYENGVAGTSFEVEKGGTITLQTVSALNGKFSVSATQKVQFSSGNLQYTTTGMHLCADGTTKPGTWSFAEHQYSMVGADNANVSPTYTGLIDLFGWGTSGYKGNHPYLTNENFDYGDGNKDITATNYDWGVYNSVGLDAPGSWRTLTIEEWRYIFFTRENAENLYGIATVNEVNGCVLLPDDWVTPDGVNFTAGVASELGDEYYKTVNNYTIEQWRTIERNGAVFLPAAGERNGEDVINFDGLYWSTSYEMDEYVYHFHYQSAILEFNSFDYSNGMSVRLVKDYSTSGTWTIADETVAEISAEGVVTGKKVGSTTATYSVNGCDREVTITVTAPDESSFMLTSDNATQTFCEGESLADIVYTASNVSDVEVTGLPAGVDYEFANNTLTISGTPTALGEFNFTVTPTPLYGTIAPLTGKITVNAVPTISAGGNEVTTVSVEVDGTLTLTPSVANGTWNVDNTNVAEISGNVLTGKSVGTTTATYSVNGCDVAVNITVTAPNVSTFELTSDNATQTFCEGESLADIVYTASNVSDAAVTGLPAGVDYEFANNTLTISGTPTALGEFNFTVTPTPLYGTIAPLTGKITVNAVPTVSVSGNVVTSVSVIENGTQVLTPSVAGGAWTVDDESVAEIVNNTLTGKSVNTTTATYTVNGCSVTINITVNEAPQEPIIMGPDGYKQGMCGGDEVPLQGSAKNVVKVYWTNYDGTVGEEIDCSATGEYEGTFIYKYVPPFQTENELIQYVTLTGVNAAGETAVQTFKIQRWFIVFEMDTYGTLTCKGAHDLKITLHNDGLRGDSQNYSIDNGYGNWTQYDIKNGDEFPLDHFVPTDRVGKRTVRVSGDDDPTTAPHRYCGQNLYFEYEVANVEIAEQNTWPASVVENGILTLNTKTVTANTYIPEGYSVVYQWQKSTDDGATWTNVGENSPSYSETFTESACYQVTATITDGTNTLCSGSTIEKRCIEMTSIVKGDDKTFFVCPGDQITLEGYAENVTSATWSEASFNPATINNGTCVSNKIYVVPADFEGEKVITLSFEDAMSNKAVQTFTIKRNPDYQVTIDAPEEYYVCLNDDVQLQASAIEGAENERYVWNVTGQAGTAMNGKYRLNTASVGNTVISVTASADNYCPATSAEVKVYVTDLSANIATDRAYICTDSEGTDGAETAINLTVTNAAGLSENITWYRNDVPVVGESGSTFTVSQAGNYYALVATQDAAGNAVCEVRSNTLNITAVELKMGERQTPDPICAGQNISLEGRADNADANTTFSWKDTNGKDWGTAKRLVLPPQTATTPNEQTTYIFTATKGVCYATQEFVVTVRPYVELDINDNGITAICKDNKEGKTISVENAVPSNAHYSWQMNGREVATGDVFRLPATAAKSAQKVIVIGSADGYCDTQSETNSKYQFVYDVSDFTWNFDAPRTYCPGDEVNLGVNVNETGTSGSVFTYKWYENGAASASSSSSLQTYPEGDTEFYVVMSNGYCTYESAHVTVLETNVSVEVSDDFSVCPGDEAVVSLKPAEASAKINWTKTDSEGTRTIGSGVKVTDKPQQNTVYTATLSNKGCENKVEVYVTMWPVPSIDTVVTVDNPKMVEILSSGGTSPYDYAIDGDGPSDYQTGAIFNGVKLGRHTAYVKDENGCRTSYVFETEALPVEFPMYFTPNGDGLNDVWNPKNIDIFERVELVIYDRFGKEVFRTHDPLEGWDGLYLGKRLPSTDYWYHLHIEETGKRYTGHFTLIN